MFLPHGKPFNTLLGQKIAKNLKFSFLPILYSFVKFAKKPRKVTLQTQNIAFAYQKTLNIWFPTWFLMRKWFANKVQSYFKIGGKNDENKFLSFICINFDNRERVTCHQIRFYIKWWVFVMMIKPWLYIWRIFYRVSTLVEFWLLHLNVVRYLLKNNV